MKLIEEFKKFAFKGNVIDMAVGIIIGGAFGKIVASLVNDLIMPLFGFILGGINFNTLSWIAIPANGDREALSIAYGAFIQTVVDFLIIAASIFLFIRLANKMMKKKEEETPPPKKDDSVVLLEEIRDLLKEK